MCRTLLGQDMQSTGTKRKLAAILMADVVGYSRLMGEDEGATVRTLKSYREVFSSQISTHDGRVVNAPGDSVLAEFGSVVDAVAAAVEIQRELAGGVCVSRAAYDQVKGKLPIEYEYQCEHEVKNVAEPYQW